MSVTIINGKRVEIPTPISGETLINKAQPSSGRRLVKQRGMEAETIDPHKIYREKDLMDKKGRPVKITTIPDRTKGSFWSVLFGSSSNTYRDSPAIFWGDRSNYSKTIIREQVYDIAAKCFKSGVEFDEEDCHWLKVNNYVLPEVWWSVAKTTPLMVVFPTLYPEIPPIGFYLKEDLAGAPDGHLHPNAYHDAAKEPLQHGWKWYCVYINQGSWRPARVKNSGDWKFGDNLWTYFTLVREALSSK